MKKAAGGVSQEMIVTDSTEAEVAQAREELMRNRLELLHDGLTVLILITVGYGVLFTPLGYNYDFPAIIRPTPETINRAIEEGAAAFAQTVTRAAATGQAVPDAQAMVAELNRLRDTAGNTQITFRGVTLYWYEWLDILRSNEQFGGIVQVTTNILRGGGRIAGMMWGAATDLTTATQIYADTGAIPVEQMISMKARFELFKLLTPGIAVVAVAGQAMDRLVLNITGQTIAGLTRAGANVGVRLFRAVLGLIGAGLLSFTGEDPLGERMQGDEVTVTSNGSNSTFDPFAAEEYLRMLGQVGIGLARAIEVTWLVAEDAANIADDDSRLPPAVRNADNQAYALGLGEAGPRYPRTAQRLGAATWAAATEAANIQADDTRLPPAGRYRGPGYGDTQRAMAQQLLGPVRATRRALRAAQAATADVMGIDNDDSSIGSRSRASPARDVTYNLRAPEQLLELAGSLGREAREIQDLVTRNPDTAIQQTAIDFIRADLLRIAGEQYNLCHVAMAFRELPRACSDEERIAPGIVRMAMLRLEPEEPDSQKSDESGVSTMTMSSIGLSGACMPFGMGVPPVIALAAAADQAQEEIPRGALSSLAAEYPSSDDEMKQDKGGKTRKIRKRKQKGGRFKLFKTAKRKKHRRTKHKNYKKGGRRSKRRKIYRGGDASAVAHVAPDPETHLPLAS